MTTLASLALFAGLFLIGYLLVARSGLVRVGSPRAAIAWALCFAIGATGSFMALTATAAVHP